MPWVQCIACPDLKREVKKVERTDLVVYHCGWGKFPYMCALSGLEKPSEGIARSAGQCKLFDRQRCVVCGGKEGLTMIGKSRLNICHEHDQAWGAWLERHPDKRDCFRGKARFIFSRWVEVFLEFAAEQKATPAAAAAGIPEVEGVTG